MSSEIKIAVKNILRKGEIACNKQIISPFLTMFSTLYGTYFPFYMHFKMSSAIYFNFDQTKILSPGNGLNIIKYISPQPVHLSMLS